MDHVVLVQLPGMQPARVVLQTSAQTTTLRGMPRSSSSMTALASSFFASLDTTTTASTANTTPAAHTVTSTAVLLPPSLPVALCPLVADP